MKLHTSLMILAAAFAVTACESDGPAENAGEAVDDMVESVADAGTDLGNAVEDACEDVKKEAGAKDTDC